MTVRKCRTCGTKHNGLLCPKSCDVVPQPGHQPFLFRVQVQHEVPLGTYAGKTRIVRSFYDVLVRALTPYGASQWAKGVHNESDKHRQHRIVCFKVYELTEPEDCGLVYEADQTPVEFTPIHRLRAAPKGKRR